MKHLLIAVVLGLAVKVSAQVSPLVKTTEAPPPKSVLEEYSKFSIGAVGAMKSINIDEGNIWGTGLKAEYSFNKYVSGGIQALTFEELGKGAFVDDLSVYGKGKFLTLDRVSLFGLVSGVRDFNVEDWGFGAGGGLTFN